MFGIKIQEEETRSEEHSWQIGLPGNVLHSFDAGILVDVDEEDTVGINDIVLRWHSIPPFSVSFSHCFCSFRRGGSCRRDGPSVPSLLSNSCSPLTRKVTVFLGTFCFNCLSLERVADKRRFGSGPKDLEVVPIVFPRSLLTKHYATKRHVSLRFSHNVTGIRVSTLVPITTSQSQA